MHVNRLKPVFKCDSEIKECFKDSQCLLTISVGQEVHEGDYFETTIDLVNSSFRSCILLIDDSLQRHSMALNSNHDADALYKSSIEAGDQWLERNEKYYRNLKILNKIIRWDYWLKHPNFETQYKKIVEFLEQSSFYKDQFEATIDAFLERYTRRMTMKLNMPRARRLCFDYLMEECTAICLWPEMLCHFEVYPSPRNFAMTATHEHFVLPTDPDLLHAVAIKFKNRKQFKKSQFENENE